VLPSDIASDTACAERFHREAEAIAALNHPNIVTIHSIEETGTVRFLTMELIEGETLGEMIPAGGMDVDSFLKIALPILEALSTAHELGILHRDLKPANIMVSREGRVKILDFGLPRLLRAESDLYQHV
jgi:serine/threonine protein kinase